MKFRKKPVVIEARQITPDTVLEVSYWCGAQIGNRPQAPRNWHLLIATLEGVMTANMGDWIIRGVQGEFYPCKPDIFEATYERVEE